MTVKIFLQKLFLIAILGNFASNIVYAGCLVSRENDIPLRGKSCKQFYNEDFIVTACNGYQCRAKKEKVSIKDVKCSKSSPASPRYILTENNIDEFIANHLKSHGVALDYEIGLANLKGKFVESDKRALISIEKASSFNSAEKTITTNEKLNSYLHGKGIKYLYIYNETKKKTKSFAINPSGFKNIHLSESIPLCD